MKIEAVVFDIGNVLVEWHPERFYDALIGPERRQALFAEVGLSEMNIRVDLGAPFRDTVLAKADTFPHWRDEILIWHDRWIEMCAPEIPRSVRLLRALRAKGLPVFALSNFGVQTYDFACGQYPFLTEFDRSYISGHRKMIKPDETFYAHLEADSGVPPEALLFADDRPENVETATRRGWQAHLFEGPDGWARRLVQEDLLSTLEAQ